MMLFSGFLIDLTSIATYLRWMQWVSVFRYASNLLAINEFRNFTLCLLPERKMCSFTGEQVLSERHISYTGSWDIWMNLLALSSIALTFFVLAYIQLVRMKKLK